MEPNENCCTQEQPQKVYSPHADAVKKRENNFNYHAPKDDTQTERYSQIRNYAKSFAEFLDGACPPSRELSLAMTKLEEVVFWANAAIARNE